METRFAIEPAHDRSPDRAFERQWALVVLGRVLDQLETEFVNRGQETLFTALKPYLTGDDTDSSYAELSRRLDLTVGNLKVTVHRLRQRYRELLKQEIFRTVDDPNLVEEEIRHLIAALSD